MTFLGIGLVGWILNIGWQAACWHTVFYRSEADKQVDRVMGTRNFVKGPMWPCAIFGILHIVLLIVYIEEMKVKGYW